MVNRKRNTCHEPLGTEEGGGEGSGVEGGVLQESRGMLHVGNS